jgi:glucokinase
VLPTLSVLALDVGGTSIKSALVQSGALRTEVRRTHIPSQTPEAQLLLTAFREIIAGYPDADALALAFPGPFDYASGVCRVQGLEKFGSLYGVNLGEALSPGRPVRFCNDAEAAILGEARHGAGVGFQRLLGITLGTGLGSAFLIEGRPVTTGPGVPPEGWLYDQPVLGRIADETFSIRGLQRRARAAGLPAVVPCEIQDEALWQSFGKELGEFLAPFVNCFGAEAVLVLGGIAGAYSLFGQALNGALAGLARPGQLGTSAALLGAASLFQQS